MNRLFAVLSLSALVLTGCSGIGTAAFPDAAANPSQVSVGSIQGSVYGGHAPLVGAHVYVLSPGTSGYGSQATSLLGATYSANGAGTTYATHLNTSDPNIPPSWYYETTDSTGAYNISNDYTCTAGYPVYLYAYGGTPTFPSANNTFSIDSINVESRGGASGAYTYTVLFHVNQGSSNPTENFYAGEPVVLSGFTGNYAFLNNTSAQFVTSNALLSTTSFEVSTSIALAQANPATTETFTSTSTTQLATGSQAATGTATVTPGFNPGVVNLAVLGVCPSTGSLAGGGTLFNGTTSNPIHYVYMNEVSTVAAAYAFEGFTPTVPTSTTNATDIGTSATNLIGIENAAITAAQLYDINGSQITTTYAGEGHIANAKTYAGNGSVPQNLLDTMGNILAACVDSNNSSTVDGNAGESAQCKTLFETATGNGIPVGGTGTPGVIPVDTAQAMINIAQHPAGDRSNNTRFMTNLYTLPTGNVPFTPNLVSTNAGQPNDFTVAIQYPENFVANTKITSATTLTPNPNANAPESIAVDSYGNLWMNNDAQDANGFYDIFEMNPQGVVTYTNATETTKVGYVTVDPANNVYSGSNYVFGQELEILASGIANQASTRTTYTYTGAYGGPNFSATGFFNGYMSVADGAGNVYIAAAPPGTTNNGITAQEYTLGLQGSINQTTPGTFNSLFTPVSLGTIVGSIGAHGAVENASVNGSGDIWWSNEESVGTTTNAFAFVRVNTSGVVAPGFPIQYSINNLLDRPEMPAIDQSGNLWAATQYGNALLEVTPSGVVSSHTGNTLTGPFGVAIDGDNNVFIGNRNSGTGTSVAVYSIANGNNISPATNGYTLSGQLTGPLNLAMDQSGNLWIAAIGGNQIVEWIGAGAPLYNPLSLASRNNGVSTRP
jgi:hypothetical protein